MAPSENTTRWPAINRRRGHLIDLEAQGKLSEEELEELEQLQRLADLQTDFLDPFSLEDLGIDPQSEHLDVTVLSPDLREIDGVSVPVFVSWGYVGQGGP